MRVSHGNAFSPEDRSSESGSITIPLLLLSVVLGGAAFSTLGYAMLWQSKAGLQLRLDRCVENVAMELVEIQKAIELGNLRIKAERAAAAAAAVPSMGSSITATQSVLEAEVALQEIQRIRWNIRQTRWIAERGCDGREDLFLPLPNLKWSRPLPDSIGLQPLAWTGNEPRLVIRLWRTNRFSQARVARGGKYGNWNATWIPRTGH